MPMVEGSRLLAQPQTGNGHFVAIDAFMRVQNSVSLVAGTGWLPLDDHRSVDVDTAQFFKLPMRSMLMPFAGAQLMH